MRVVTTPRSDTIKKLRIDRNHDVGGNKKQTLWRAVTLCMHTKFSSREGVVCH